MFSYRHAFHAGNHADVLKHITLLATLRHLMKKDAGLTLIDTHAGAGLYRLDGQQAQTSGEASDGVRKLQAAVASGELSDPAPALQDYLDLIASFNPSRSQPVYPGSPLLMHQVLRPASRDRLRLFELHPTDSRSLSGHIEQVNAGAQSAVHLQDGFEGLKAQLPPPAGPGGSRRALVLMDPSYEIKSDYGRVAGSVTDALKRFPTGCYLVWYPLIARPEAHSLPRRLKTLPTTRSAAGCTPPCPSGKRPTQASARA